MSIEGFETLTVALLFLVPGALFLYVCASYYAPAVRGEYLSRQFPLELVFYYLLASAIIHGILLALGGGIILGVALLTRNPELVKDWYSVLSQFPQVSVAEFLIILLVGIVYLILSLLLAYFGAKRLRQHLLLPTPLWCGEMVRILAQEKSIIVSALMCDAESTVVEGKLGSFQFVGEKGKAFELLLLTEGTKSSRTTVWLDSSVIREMEMRNSQESWRFVFAAKPASKGE